MVLSKLLSNPRELHLDRDRTDIKFTTHEKRIPSKHTVITNSISDHDIIITRKMNCLKFKPRKINIRSSTNYNFRHFKNGLREVLWETLIDENDIQSRWNSSQTLTNVINRHDPLIEKKVRAVIILG